MTRTPDLDAALFERLRPRLTAISRRIVGSQADAEDVVQDCFFKWHGAGQDAVETPAAWLTTVVQRQSIDRLRQRARDAAALDTAAVGFDGALHGALALPEQALPEHVLLQRAKLGEAWARMLARLSPAERLALVLREVFECEHADIAATLGTTAANARQLLSRARRRVRAHEHEHEHGGEPALDEKHCRELVRRFQAAINGLDLPAMLTLLAGEQPVSVLRSMPPSMRARACANDAVYAMALVA
jgi:RNA polymerase sigma factor (sigma-70 family)